MKWLACVCLLGVAGGCAVLKPTRSGYLSDYAQVKPVPDKSPRTLAERPAEAGKLAGIDSFYIEDVAWRSVRPAKVAKDPALQEQVLKALREALVKELSQVRPVLDQPGPHTARVRAAVTDARNADLLFNLIMTAIAIPVANGGATVETEVLAPDGKQIAAVDYARAGGFFDIIGYYWPNDHAKIACRTAAAELRNALEAGAPAREPVTAAARAAGPPHSDHH
jgi:hypothetical protein